MSTTVFAAVLAAAFMHAGWNALVKLRLEPIVTMALITASAGLIALPALLWFGLPKLEAWALADRLDHPAPRLLHRPDGGLPAG